MHSDNDKKFKKKKKYSQLLFTQSSFTLRKYFQFLFLINYKTIIYFQYFMFLKIYTRNSEKNITIL